MGRVGACLRCARCAQSSRDAARVCKSNYIYNTSAHAVDFFTPNFAPNETTAPPSRHPSSPNTCRRPALAVETCRRQALLVRSLTCFLTRAVILSGHTLSKLVGIAIGRKATRPRSWRLGGQSVLIAVVELHTEANFHILQPASAAVYSVLGLNPSSHSHKDHILQRNGKPPAGACGPMRAQRNTSNTRVATSDKNKNRRGAT